MADLDERFRSLSRTGSPDLWSDIETREPRSGLPPTPWSNRVFAAAVALVIAVAGIGFAALTFGGPEPQSATGTSGSLVGPRANGEIWFRVGGGEGGSRIDAVAPDGASRRVVFSTDDGSHRSRISFSPDGSRIAYDNYVVGAYGIGTANLDGSEAMRLTDGVNDSWPSWSPDGTQLLFSSTSYDPSIGRCEAGFPHEFDCPTDIYVMDSDGSNLVRLTSDPADEFMPVWSPDGTTIAFVRNTEKASVFRPAIFTMRPDGSDVHQVSSGDGGSDWWPSWSPDGSRIAFAAIRNEDWGIWTVGADGENERMVFGGTGAGYVDNPVWSPDGSLIAFVGNLEIDDYSPEDALYVMDPDGTGVTPLADAPGIGVAGDIAWQPLPAAAEPSSSSPPTSAEVVETFAVGEVVSSVAYGEGSVWVAVSHSDGSFGGRIVRIDPATNDVQAEIPVEVIPTWEVGGGAMVIEDGSLWVTGSLEAPGAFDDPGGGADAAVIRIDTSANEVAQTFELGGTHGADLTFLDGDLWVLLFGDETVDNAMEVVRVDPQTGDVGPRFRLNSNWAHTIVAADGMLVTTVGGEDAVNIDGRVIQVDPKASAISGSEIPSPAFTPMPVLWQEHVWISTDPGFVRYDPLREGFPEPPVALPARFGDCCGFLESDDRGIWFLSPDLEGGSARHLVLFDPATGQATSLVDVDEGSPVAMAVAPDSVWILNYEGTLTHVALD